MTKEKNKVKIKDNVLIQLKLSLEDLRHGRVKKFNLKSFIESYRINER